MIKHPDFPHLLIFESVFVKLYIHVKYVHSRCSCLRIYRVLQVYTFCLNLFFLYFQDPTHAFPYLTAVILSLVVGTFGNLMIVGKSFVKVPTWVMVSDVDNL